MTGRRTNLTLGGGGREGARAVTVWARRRPSRLLGLRIAAVSLLALLLIAAIQQLA